MSWLFEKLDLLERAYIHLLEKWISAGFGPPNVFQQAYISGVAFMLTLATMLWFIWLVFALLNLLVDIAFPEDTPPRRRGQLAGEDH